MRRLLLLILIATAAAPLQAQEGTSSAAASRAKYLSELGIIPASREVVVEEIVNFHRHDIGRPRAGEAVHLDVRWGSAEASREAILQVGLSTASVKDRQQLPPINLALVIDKSGSMNEAGKMTRVKEALGTLITQLRPVDTLSITVFNEEADVCLPARKVSNPAEIRSLIESIQPGGYTNIHSGLMLGYSEALKNYRKDGSNRVILLTDGIANRGVTEPKRVAADSLAFNDRGIDLSTIGVGQDLNKELLRELAESGRGLYHFVGETDDVQRIFIQEVQSLLSPVASEPNLEIVHGSDLRVEQVYGYAPKRTANSVRLELDNMNSGLTQVVLLRLRPARRSGEVPVKVRLTYYDLEQKKQVAKTETALIKVGRETGDKVEDPEVAKNLTIATLAQSIHDMAAAVEREKFKDAETILGRAIDATTSRYPNLEDPDIRRNFDLAQKYRQVLIKQNALRSEGINLIFNGDFSKGNVGFTSELTYTAPAYNCLWPSGYTVARTWNDPLLHRLHPAEPYLTPERLTGREGAMYANAGGHEALTLWTSTVTCEPNTRYRLSFQTITLNSGEEWVPSYEIRVNGTRSEAQLAPNLVWTPISMTWNSGRSRSASISIVRMPMGHNGGLVGIAAIKMIKAE